MKETESSMAKFTHILKGRLHLGASLTMGEFILPQLLGPFGIQHPHIFLSMKVMNTTQILDEIIHNQLNFGLIEAPIDHPDVQTDAIMSIMELGSTGAIKSAVEANLGITILSQSSIKHELALGLLTTKKIKGLRFIRSFYSIYLRSTLLPLSAVAFLSFFREHVEKQRSLLDENT
jgi:DNA-binding transcriptional LysR family regulator